MQVTSVTNSTTINQDAKQWLKKTHNDGAVQPTTTKDHTPQSKKQKKTINNFKKKNKEWKKKEVIAKQKITRKTKQRKGKSKILIEVTTTTNKWKKILKTLQAQRNIRVSLHSKWTTNELVEGAASMLAKWIVSTFAKWTMNVLAKGTTNALVEWTMSLKNEQQANL